MHAACGKNNLSLNISAAQGVSSKNVKRLPRAIFEHGICPEWEKLGLPLDVLESRLPNSLQGANFEHSYKVGGQKFVLIQGTLETLDQGGLTYMLIKFACLLYTSDAADDM
eukprot:3215382-Karenia_brevis.AAC.1